MTKKGERTGPGIRMEEFDDPKVLKVQYVEKHNGEVFTVTVVTGDRMNDKNDKGNFALRKVTEIKGPDRSHEPKLPGVAK